MIICDLKDRTQFAVESIENVNHLPSDLINLIDQWIQNGSLACRDDILKFNYILKYEKELIAIKVKFICGNRFIIKYSDLRSLLTILKNANEYMEKIAKENECYVIQFEVSPENLTPDFTKNLNGYFVASFVFSKNTSQNKSAPSRDIIFNEIDFSSKVNNAYFSLSDLSNRFENVGPTVLNTDLYENVYREYCDFSNFKNGTFEVKGIRYTEESQTAFCYFLLFKDIKVAMVGFIYVPRNLRGKNLGIKLLIEMEKTITSTIDIIDYVVAPTNYSAINMLKQAGFTFAQAIFNKRCLD